MDAPPSKKATPSKKDAPLKEKPQSFNRMRKGLPSLLTEGSSSAADQPELVGSTVLPTLPLIPVPTEETETSH